MEKGPQEQGDACCPPSRVPPLVNGSNYVAKGEEKTVKNELNGKDLRLYVTGNASSSLAIVLFHDIFGLDSGNHRQVCDVWAEAFNCQVYMPDFFRGDVLKSVDDVVTPKFLELVKRHPFEEVAKDLAETYKQIPASVSKISLIGFCWGCWVLIKEGGRVECDPRVACGCCFHPAFGIEGIFGGEQKAFVEANKIPLLMCPCKDDPPDTKPGGLVSNDIATFHVFENQNHGFMTQFQEPGDDNKLGIDLAVKFISDKSGIAASAPSGDASSSAATSAPESIPASKQ